MLPKVPKAGEVAAQLGRRDAHQVGELVRVDVLHAVAVEFLEHLAVDAETLHGCRETRLAGRCCGAEASGSRPVCSSVLKDPPTVLRL